MNASKPIDIALADSNPLMLSALSEQFDRDPRFSLVTTAATAEGFLEAVIRVPVTVGIIDWNLPQLGGERLTEVLRAQERAPRVVVYGHSADQDTVRKAMEAGAAGFCVRSESVETLLDVAARVGGGQMVFPYLDVRTLRQSPLQSLTKKERVLLDALAKGHSNKVLARELGISVNTVKFHLRNLFEKLSVSNRAQAIAFYYSNMPNAPALGLAPKPEEFDEEL